MINKETSNYNAELIYVSLPLKFSLGAFGLAFLNASTIGILGLVIFCRGSLSYAPMHCSTFRASLVSTH